MAAMSRPNSSLEYSNLSLMDMARVRSAIDCWLNFSESSLAALCRNNASTPALAVFFAGAGAGAAAGGGTGAGAGASTTGSGLGAGGGGAGAGSTSTLGGNGSETVFFYRGSRRWRGGKRPTHWLWCRRGLCIEVSLIKLTNIAEHQIALNIGNISLIQANGFV